MPSSGVKVYRHIIEISLSQYLTLLVPRLEAAARCQNCPKQSILVKNGWLAYNFGSPQPVVEEHCHLKLLGFLDDHAETVFILTLGSLL